MNFNLYLYILKTKTKQTINEDFINLETVFINSLLFTVGRIVYNFVNVFDL